MSVMSVVDAVERRPLCGILEYVVREQMKEIDRLRDEVSRLVNWIMGDRDALTTLQAIYNNDEASQANRIKAAAAAIGFERSKVTVNVRVGPALLGERLDNARPMKTIEPVTIEHQASG
jgi:hypothetical protein